MSMGGMIAQTAAIRHPDRVLSLTSVYSTTGSPKIPQPKPEIMSLLLKAPPKEREGYIDYMLTVFKALTGPAFPLDEHWARQNLARSFDRCYYPQGVGRQLIAILSHGSRTRFLAELQVPTLVIHGTADPLVPVEGGEDTARVIPGAHLMLIEGMGHDVPHGGAWPQIIEAITAHTQRVRS
jgi:pimeloyl-ACP methyl ester carboxylesterase